MTPETSILYFKYLMFLVVGFIIGRISMAIQYAAMKGKPKPWKFWK